MFGMSTAIRDELHKAARAKRALADLEKELAVREQEHRKEARSLAQLRYRIKQYYKKIDLANETIRVMRCVDGN